MSGGGDRARGADPEMQENADMGVQDRAGEGGTPFKATTSAFIGAIHPALDSPFAGNNIIPVSPEIPT